jgi:hypothetical protein
LLDFVSGLTSLWKRQDSIESMQATSSQSIVELDRLCFCSPQYGLMKSRSEHFFLCCDKIHASILSIHLRINIVLYYYMDQIIVTRPSVGGLCAAVCSSDLVRLPYITTVRPGISSCAIESSLS